MTRPSMRTITLTEVGRRTCDGTISFPKTRRCFMARKEFTRALSATILETTIAAAEQFISTTMFAR